MMHEPAISALKSNPERRDHSQWSLFRLWLRGTNLWRWWTSPWTRAKR